MLGGERRFDRPQTRPTPLQAELKVCKLWHLGSQAFVGSGVPMSGQAPDPISLGAFKVKVVLHTPHY